MISVKKLVDSSGKQFYLVESRLPDGKLQCITRSYEFRCGTRGFEDGDARGRALRFAITTDSLPQFRDFIFKEQGSASPGRTDGSVPSLPTRLDSPSLLGRPQESFKRRIRSYVCMRQNRLTGLRFVVAISRLENGHLRAVSFQDHSLAGAGISDEALNRAVRFLRGVAFESWRKQAMSELITRDREPVGHRRERALKHVSAFVEIEAGEKVDCACGKNRSRGLMVACERCGAWEHAECQGFRSDKQIPADYICSACMRAEGEDVVVIRLDEQGECGNLQLEDLWTVAKIRCKEADDVCCVCGCEDNQDFETMIPPMNEHLCDSGAALAHPSCISAAQYPLHKAWNVKAIAAGICQLCGDRFLKCPKASEEVYPVTSSGVAQSKPLKGSTSPGQSQSGSFRRSVKVDQSGRGAKRLRSALTNGAVIAKQETGDKRPAKGVKEEEIEVDGIQSGERMHSMASEANKVTETILGRRFNDPAVTVPIKKRRLQMVDVVRSPSPTRGSPSPLPQVNILLPKTELVDQRDLQVNGEVMHGSEDADMAEVRSLEDVAAGVCAGSHDVMEEMKDGNIEIKDAGASSSASQGRSRDVRLHWDLNMDMEQWGSPPEEDTGTFSGVRLGLACSVSQGNDGNGNLSDEEERLSSMEKVLPEKSDEQLQSRDSPLLATLQEWNEDPVEELEAEHVDYDDSDSREGEEVVGDVCLGLASTVSQVDDVNDDESDEEDELAPRFKDLLTENYDEKLQSTHSCVDGSPPQWNGDPVEELEAEHVDYDDSDCRDGEEVGSEAGEKGESELRENDGPGRPEQADGAQECGVDVGIKPGPAGDIGREIILTGELREVVLVGGRGLQSGDVDSHFTGLKVMVVEEPDIGLRDSRDFVSLPKQNDEKDDLQVEVGDAQLCEKPGNVIKLDDKQVQNAKEAFTFGSSTRRADGQSRAKSSGWDQLPDGFDKAEDALRAAKEISAVRSGRGSLWGTANGRGASVSPRSVPINSRFGRGLRTEGLGDRARSEDSWNREDHQLVQRVDDNVDISPRLVSPRELGRGRSHMRGGSPVVRGRGRMDPWIDSPGVAPSPWGPSRHPSPGRYGDGGFGPRVPPNAAAMAAAKVESSGFVVAPDGTVTKAGSSARGPPRPFQSGGRSGRGVIFNMGRGGPGMNMGLGMNLGGLRMQIGRGIGIGPGMGINIGVGMGMGVGPGLGLGMPGRGGRGGRVMVERLAAPYNGRGSAGGHMVENSPSLRRGRSREDYSESWSRRDDPSSSPRKTSTSRRSRSGSPSRSKSRTRSPKATTPPRPANSSGSGGVVLSKSCKKRSHSPAAHKPEPRVENAESPPRRLVPPPPKLPLPPPPPRNQRSPPAALKRLTDNKKDGDRARSRDLDRERERDRPATRTRTPPRRTSPHVVHGSALTDERDRQLLAGIRHVSPISTRIRSSETLGLGAVASSYDSPPLASTAGQMAEGTGDARRHSGDEGGDGRIHGLKREEIGIKGELRSSKETSRGERERNSRRESGRDRDEERKDLSKSSFSSRDRDGRSSSSLKYSHEGDDDIAPRRRRPSP